MHLGRPPGERSVTRRRSAQHTRTFSLAVRMLLGVGAFGWATLVLGSAVRRISPDPYWPVYLIGGGLFGAAATLVTRDASRRPLGWSLAALGFGSLCLFVTLLLLPYDTDVLIEGFLPVEKFIVITLLSIPLWLFLSSRAGRHGTERPDQYEDVFE